MSRTSSFICNVPKSTVQLQSRSISLSSSVIPLEGVFAALLKVRKFLSVHIEIRVFSQRLQPDRKCNFHPAQGSQSHQIWVDMRTTDH